MQIQDLVNILMQGVPIWNGWRRANPTIQPNLDGLDFSQIFKDLRGTHLHMASVEGAWFNGVDMSGANLNFSSLRGQICMVQI